MTVGKGLLDGDEEGRALAANMRERAVNPPADGEAEGSGQSGRTLSWVEWIEQLKEWSVAEAVPTSRILVYPINATEFCLRGLFAMTAQTRISADAAAAPESPRSCKRMGTAELTFHTAGSPP